MERLSVHVVGGGRDYERMYINNGFEVVDSPFDADLLQFTGGEDVSPSLYGAEKHPATYNNPDRDRVEAELYRYALAEGKPMVGICRGGQFLNVMCGGSMHQHVNNHAIAGTHIAVVVDTGEMLSVTSTHHQMMNPSEYGQVIMVASEATWFEDVVDDEVFRHDITERGEDVEAVWYPSDKVLCYQPHPEYVAAEHECQRQFFSFLKQYLLN